ncbi:MAG: hypothetical protein U5L08_16540 [Xanthomonadales bacterium]|nr:hypothetical protein [Xanthomonadales bacterium]
MSQLKRFRPWPSSGLVRHSERTRPARSAFAHSSLLTAAFFLAIAITGLAQAQTECPTPPEDVKSPANEEYFEVLAFGAPEHYRDEPLSGDTYICFQEMAELVRMDEPAGLELLKQVTDSDLGQALRYLVVTPTTEMTFSDLMTRVSAADDRRLWLEVTANMQKGITPEIDLAASEIRQEWFPDDVEIAFQFTDAMVEVTGNRSYWRGVMNELLTAQSESLTEASCRSLLKQGLNWGELKKIQDAGHTVPDALIDRVRSQECQTFGLQLDVSAANRRFEDFTKDLNEEGTGFTSQPRPPLPDDPNSDFRELPIGAGVLIHDQCFQDERLQELGGIQSAVEESIAKFAVCQTEINQWQPGGAAERLHIPEMMNVLDGEVSWIPEAYGDHDGTRRIVNNACEDISTFEFYDEMTVHGHCQDLRQYKNELLKVFCQFGSYDVAKKQKMGYDLTSSDTDTTAQGTRYDMTFINWKEQTKVYNGPYISIHPDRRVSRGELISTLGHEFIHTLHAHNVHHYTYPLNDFATMCEAACFYDDWGMTKITGQDWGDAVDACNSLGEPDRIDRSTASRIREAL